MPDHRQLAILIKLRKAARVTLAQMAQACGLSGSRAYESASAWERGESIPRSSVRNAFIGYLTYTLGLATDRALLGSVWEVLVHEWGWEPLQAADWRLIESGAALPDPAEALQSPPRPPTSVLLTPERPPEPAPLPPGSLLPFAPLPHFVGRARELLAIADQLTCSGADAFTPMPQTALTGPGGIGKTQLAIEFAYRFGRHFPGGVFWLSCANGEALPAAIAACGSVMGLHPEFADLSLDEQICLVTSAWQLAPLRLLIFDGCEEEAVLRRWRPQRGGCSLLVTSRRAHWPAQLALTTLPLGLLSRMESVALLHQHCPLVQLRAEELVALAAELDDLPLALHLAGSYMARGMDALTPGQYLAELRQSLAVGASNNGSHPSLRGEGPHGRPLPAPSGHLNNLEQTFALSLARLDPDEPCDQIARRLLTRAAWFAPGELIPVELLTATLDETAYHKGPAARELGRALQRLVDVGLLMLHEHRVRLHRLIAAFVRQQVTDEAAQTEVEQLLLERSR